MKKFIRIELIAAVLVTGFTSGRSGLRDLVRRMRRWRLSPVWWLVVASPIVVLGLALAGMRLAGQDLPAWGDFAMFNGLPAYGVVWTLLLVFVLSVIAGAWQWGRLLAALGIALGWRKLLELYWVGLFFNNLMPGNLGGDVVKVVDLSRAARDPVASATASRTPAASFTKILPPAASPSMLGVSSSGCP